MFCFFVYEKCSRSLCAAQINHTTNEGLWEGGNGYLSFLSKCVSNPASCAALGESDPPQPCDPAARLCLSALRVTHSPSQQGTGPTGRCALDRFAVIYQKKLSNCFFSIISAVRAPPQMLLHRPPVLNYVPASKRHNEKINVNK